MTAIDCSPCRHIVGLGLASLAFFDLILILETIIRLRAGAVLFSHRCIALFTTVVVVIVVMMVIVCNWSIVIVMVVPDLIWSAVLFGRFIFRKVFLVNLILILSEILVGVTVVLKILIARHGGG